MLSASNEMQTLQIVHGVGQSSPETGAYTRGLAAGCDDARPTVIVLLLFALIFVFLLSSQRELKKTGLQ